MKETIVRIITESGTAVTFILSLDMQEVLNDIEGYSKGVSSNSATIIAGLLQDAPTRPILSGEDLRLATVIYSSKTRLLKWCYEGQETAYTKLLKRTTLTKIGY